MQTFLPYKSFSKSLRCLDYRRLGKQRVEAKQILEALRPDSTSRWRNHPAVRMWRGYEVALSIYHNTAIHEWEKRGYKNNMEYIRFSPAKNKLVYPEWITNEFCNSHRSNLLRKDPEFYGRYGWGVPDNLPYIWPA